MSLSARRFAAPSLARQEVIAAAAMDYDLLVEFGVDAPAWVGTRGPVARDSFEYHRSCYCCEECEGPYRNFLQVMEDMGIEVPAGEWEIVARREESERNYEIGKAYFQKEVQDKLDAGWVVIEADDDNWGRDVFMASDLPGNADDWRAVRLVAPGSDLAIRAAVISIMEAA